MQYLGIDLGGTNVAAAAVDETGRILTKTSAPTPSAPSCETVAAEICRQARRAAELAGAPLSSFASVGVGSPGVANSATGIVEYCSNLGFLNAPLAAAVSEGLGGLPAFLENDANAAALGEFAAGSGVGVENFVAVTLGTGVGGGIFVDGRLVTGINHAGGEIGHMVIRQGGEPCTCGRRGCFEAYASATALIRQTRRAMERTPESALWRFAPSLGQVDGRTAFSAARAGDPAARAVVEEYIEALACGLANLVNIFQPELLCVGGGVGNEGEALLAPVRALVDRADYARQSRARCKIVPASLGNDAGLIGAALLPRFRSPRFSPLGRD